MLPLRICLALAIAAGIAVIAVSQFVVKPKVQLIIDARDDFNNKWKKSEEEKRKVTKDLKDTQEKLRSTEEDLTTTRQDLTSTKSSLAKEEEKSKGLTSTVAKQKDQLKQRDDELARWTGTGLTPDQIAGLQGQLKDARSVSDALTEENKIFTDKIKKLQARLDDVFGKQDPDVPATVRGKVLVVDPKWDFVILDVGSRHNLPERGVLLISRNGTLVAKVRVLNVENDRCVANIMPGWKLNDVLEGDEVFPYAPKNL
ncbi:MAG: hypothetical protein RJA22_3280 [Verrucomicrobiota bacterium]